MLVNPYGRGRASGAFEALTAMRHIPNVKAYSSSAQTVNTGTETVLHFEAEYFDTHGMHSTSENTGRLTCTVPGYYFVLGTVEFSSSNAGRRQLFVKKNGSEYVARVSTAPISGSVIRMQISSYVYLEAGDYIELAAYQDSGSSLMVNVQPYTSPVFSSFKVG